MECYTLYVHTYNANHLNRIPNSFLFRPLSHHFLGRDEKKPFYFLSRLGFFPIVFCILNCERLTVASPCHMQYALRRKFQAQNVMWLDVSMCMYGICYAYVQHLPNYQYYNKCTLCRMYMYMQCSSVEELGITHLIVTMRINKRNHECMLGYWRLQVRANIYIYQRQTPGV